MLTAGKYLEGQQAAAAPGLCASSDGQTSAITQPMESSVSDDDEPGGWLDSISPDLRSVAICFKDSTMPVLGGVISLVRNAAKAVAAELAQLEHDGEFDDGRWRNNTEIESLTLPWEIQQECMNSNDVPLYVTDEALMDIILALSMDDSTFSTPYSDMEPQGDYSAGEYFALDPSRMALIQRLLDADENLADAYTRLQRGN
jgi:hypothetical protein